MEPKQAKRLGAILRGRRSELALSSREVARRAGVPDSTLVRLEQGIFLSPRPEKLATIAQVLGLSTTSILDLAGYPSLTELPRPSVYLRSKYPGLATPALDELTRSVERLLKRHGIDPGDGPINAEDEEPEAPDQRTKKGGKR